MNLFYSIISISFLLYAGDLQCRELTEKEYDIVSQEFQRQGGKTWHAYGTVNQSDGMYNGFAYVIDEPKQLENICISIAAFLDAQAKSVESLSWKVSPITRYHIWFNACDTATKENSIVLNKLIASEALFRIKENENRLLSDSRKFISLPELEEISGTKSRLAGINLRIDDGVGIVYTAEFEIKECLGLSVHFTFENFRPKVLGAWKILC